MNEFLSTESKFYKISTILKDIIFTSILFTIFSIPIITIGATITGLYYVCTKKASGKDEYFMRGFLKSFSENFMKATIAFAIVAGIIIIIIINMLIPFDFGAVSIVVLGIQIFMLAQALFIFMYAFPLLARFELTVKGCLKLAFMLANKHMLTTLTNLGFLIAITLVSIYLPMLTIFVVGIYIYLSSILFVKIFRKHDPKFDEAVDQSFKPLNLP
ncbi:MAG: DUF624 domain-containing protein [Defluviitaleaceae bacterium]|nr:DUF624 domain-containing protein [Defluviitaleaceae bacterium]